jgi:hypothetical protein
MDQLRAHESNGMVVAVSIDGQRFTAVGDGATFAERNMDLFQMTNGTASGLGGAVIFIPNPKGEEVAAFWLEENVSPDASGNHS